MILNWKSIVQVRIPTSSKSVQNSIVKSKSSKSFTAVDIYKTLTLWLNSHENRKITTGSNNFHMKVTGLTTVLHDPATKKMVKLPVIRRQVSKSRFSNKIVKPGVLQGCLWFLSLRRVTSRLLIKVCRCQHLGWIC